MSDLPYKVAILEKAWLTPTVLCLKLERPEGFDFAPGQAVELTIDDLQFHTDASPFTLSNPLDIHHLELTFKVYPENQGMTLGLSRLEVGDSLWISDPWDSFPYKGPGTFIAGGAGLTAFLPIIRALHAKGELGGHQLIVAHRKHRDIFLEKELKNAFGSRLTHILSKARTLQHSFGHINKDFLRFKIPNPDQNFYVCGPRNFPDTVKAALLQIGAKSNSIFIAY